MNVVQKAINARKYELEQQVGYLLRLASQRHSAIFQKHAPHNLTPMQFSALVRLSELGEMSQNHLGRTAAMDVATVKGVVDRLKAKGLVQTRPDQVDKRRSVISLTDAGQALIGDLEDAGLQISEDTLSPLSAAERRALVDLLQKIS